MTAVEINTIIDHIFTKLGCPVNKGLESISALGSMRIIPAVISSLFGIISLVAVFILVIQLWRITTKEVEMKEVEMKDIKEQEYIVDVILATAFFGVILFISAGSAYDAWYDYILCSKSPGAYGIKYITEEIILRMPKMR